MVPFLCLGLVINLRLVKKYSFKLLLLTTILILVLPLSIFIIPLKNSLELLINVEAYLEPLRTTQVFSYILLKVWSLICLLLDPHLCGYIFFILIISYRVTRYFPILTHT